MAVYVCLLLFTVYHAVLGANELSIEPAVDRLFVSDGEPLMLLCSFKSDNNSDDSLHVEWKPTRPNAAYDTETNKVTMQIERFSVDDYEGVYTCELKNKVDGVVLMSKNITLTGITETKTSPELERDIGDNRPYLTQNLVCNISVSLDSLKISGPEWFQNKTSIEDPSIDDTRFKIKNMNTLEIKNPTPADLGVYFAKYEISDGQNSYFHQCKVEIRARPQVDHKPAGCKNVIEGKKVDLQCNVWGYPRPVITWYKDNHHVNVTQGSSKVMMKPLNGYKDAHLMIDSADFSDSGEYRCVAITKEMNATTSQDICVGVKDKHAALWPFLAIVCEVLVLCAIIFVYEKKRNDKAKAAEREAQEAPNTEVKSKVRNRRQPSN